MTKPQTVFLGLSALMLMALASAASLSQPPSDTRVVLIVVDGLRPDAVTPEVMPRLHALGARGLVATAHHSVFPTVTRVNATSLATGAYPESHGLLGNTVFSPATFPTKGVNTSQHAELEAMDRAEGPLITAPTLGLLLARAGKRLVVFSAGSSGSAMLLSHPLGNGAVVNPELIRPAAIEPAVGRAAGPSPAEAVPNNARNRWIVDAYLALGATDLAADVTAFWFGDPDESAHATGLGSPETLQSLRYVEAEIGRIEDGLRARGALATTTILVTSDHGFSTHTGELKLAALVAPLAHPLPDGSPDIVVTEGAVNFRRGAGAARVAAIVRALQARPEVGAIFTAPGRPGSVLGTADGTLSFDVARWRHARAGAILVSGNWTAARNGAGVAGTTTQSGVAGHGTSSPYDIHNTLLLDGPTVRPGATSAVPTSNSDLAPTLLTLLGLPVPPSMTGRAATELFRSGPAPASVTVTTRVETARTADGRYHLDAHISTVAGHDYLDHTEVRRQPR
ncbi:MAG: alkaline phosphatase family protein [Acidobacteria bacterium]|nr:alkaline phosphatase family protein [Acidobacteriota bacterium]